MKQLDGIRGLAILLVLAFHCRVVFATTAEIPFLGFRILALGWSGVDLFFVLSGFLITGILMDTRESSTYFRTFYARRMLRIFPLYFFYLFLILVLCRQGWIWIAGEDLWKETNAWWFITYMVNWRPDGYPVDRFLSHLWSLAIEEQFYFVWPAVVWLVPRRKLSWVCAGVAVIALAVRCWMSAAGVDSLRIYGSTPCRMDCLAMGGFVAVGIRDFRPLLERWSGRVSYICGAIFLVALVYSPDPLWSNQPMRTFGDTALAGLYACIVYRAATASCGWTHHFFSNGLLRSFGKLSYGIYVFHFAPWNMTATWAREVSGTGLPQALTLLIKYAYFPALAATSFGLAWLSSKYLEQPILALKVWFPYEPPDRMIPKAVDPGCVAVTRIS